MNKEQLEVLLKDLNTVMVNHNICLDGTEGMLARRDDKTPVGYIEGTLGGQLYIVSIDEVTILAEIKNDSPKDDRQLK